MMQMTLYPGNEWEKSLSLSLSLSLARISSCHSFGDELHFLAGRDVAQEVHFNATFLTSLSLSLLILMLPFSWTRSKENFKSLLSYYTSYKLHCHLSPEGRKIK